MIILMLVFPYFTNATSREALFVLFGVDNMPQQAMFSTSIISCAKTCLMQSECRGYNFQSQSNESAHGCFLYNWLTKGGGDVKVFASLPEEYTTSAIIFGEFSLCIVFCLKTIQRPMHAHV